MIVGIQLVYLSRATVCTCDKDTFLAIGCAILPPALVQKHLDAAAIISETALGKTSGMVWDETDGKLYISRLSVVFVLSGLPTEDNTTRASFVPLLQRGYPFFFKIAIQGQHLLTTISDSDVAIVQMFDKVTGQLITNFKESEEQCLIRRRSQDDISLRRWRKSLEVCGIALHGEHVYLSTTGSIAGFDLNSGVPLPLFTGGHPSMPLLPSPTEAASTDIWGNLHDLAISGDFLYAVHSCRVIVYQ